MKMTKNYMLYLAMAAVLQACSGSSDMGASLSLEPDTAAAQQSVNVDSDVLANASNIRCDASAADFEETMLAAINNSRQVARMCGTESRPAVNVVSWNDKLATAAVDHAQDMVTSNFFSHTGSDGLGVSDRAEAATYDWRAIGENIAAGQSNIEEVHQVWLDSAGHCRNIMNASYSEVGAACLDGGGSDYSTYWVVVFGDHR